VRLGKYSNRGIIPLTNLDSDSIDPQYGCYMRVKPTTTGMVTILIRQMLFVELPDNNSEIGETDNLAA